LELLLRRLERLLEARDLALDVARLDVALRDLDVRRVEEKRAADRDARRDGDALELDHSSLNFESMTFSRAATAAAESSPSARRWSVEPHSAASIMSPKMLFPLTSCPSFTTAISALKPF